MLCWLGCIIICVYSCWYLCGKYVKYTHMHMLAHVRSHTIHWLHTNKYLDRKHSQMPVCVVLFVIVNLHAPTVDKFRVGRELYIAMDIKPRSQEGVLVSVHGNGSDFVVLQLTDGAVSMKHFSHCTLSQTNYIHFVHFYLTTDILNDRHCVHCY